MHMCVGLDGAQYQEDLRLTEQKVEQQRKIAERAEKDLEPVDVSLPGEGGWVCVGGCGGRGEGCVGEGGMLHDEGGGATTQM